jgi:hypothetical protein
VRSIRVEDVYTPAVQRYEHGSGIRDRVNCMLYRQLELISMIDIGAFA